MHEIVKGRRSVTADTAERLARYFGGDAVSWLAMQASYDLKPNAFKAYVCQWSFYQT
jgi:addiction module HigA family antidote